jgi:hypothetical protein
LADELDPTVANTDRRDICRRHVFEPDRIVLRPIKSLGLEVRHVHGVAGEKEVVGIDAAAFVAAMAHHRLRWNRSVPQHPGQPMREVGAAAHRQMAVAAVREAALPDVAAG